jgi:uncharacterized protein
MWRALRSYTGFLLHYSKTPGYKAFFHHIDVPMKVMAELFHRSRPAAEIMNWYARQDANQVEAFRRRSANDPCPCGSGRKYKRCHGSA